MKKWVFLMTALLSSSVCAQGQWLAQMLAQREQGHAPSTSAAVQQQPQRNGFFQNHALVLFYASTCPHCHRFAPVLKNWADTYGASVLPFSFDNQPLAQFLDFKPATSEWVQAAFAGRAISYPALFIINTQTHALYPVTIGAMSEIELANRMQDFIPKIINHERGAV